MEAEEKLTGGNLTAVSRVGKTVRRTAGPWTENIHRLLKVLRARGIDAVPEPLGFDAQGREILSFLPGQVGHFPTLELRSDEILMAAARLLRQIHDATLELAQTSPTGWKVPVREPIEVICHGDFAPYNCVFEQGKLTGVIDFDQAHPGPRAWDLAYASTVLPRSWRPQTRNATAPPLNKPAAPASFARPMACKNVRGWSPPCWHA